MKRKILIVDDDAELCEEMSEVLHGEGYAADIALNGAQAQKLMQTRAYDVVILDYKMPGLNGLEILKSLSHKKLGTKIFIASGRPFMDQLLAAENLTGLVAGSISKPFQVQTLLEKIKSA